MDYAIIMPASLIRVPFQVPRVQLFHFQSSSMLTYLRKKWNTAQEDWTHSDGDLNSWPGSPSCCTHMGEIEQIQDLSLSLTPSLPPSLLPFCPLSPLSSPRPYLSAFQIKLNFKKNKIKEILHGWERKSFILILLPSRFKVHI